MRKRGALLLLRNALVNPEVVITNASSAIRDQFDVEAQIGAVVHEEIRRRAIDGWDAPVFWRGQQCGTIRKKSDRLLCLRYERIVIPMTEARRG